jgi:predicted phage terminase large subunit-like protein
VFVPAKLDDNPNLDRPDYVESLAELDPVTRAQLLAGDWDAVAGGRFRREWLRRYVLRSGGVYGAGEYELQLPGGACVRKVQLCDCWRFCTVDPAASSMETAKSSDPDYTVISTWGVTPHNELLWLDCHRFRLEIPDILSQIQSVHNQWNPSFVAIEAVASNRAVLQHAMRTAMPVRELSPGGKDKLVRATPAICYAESGKLYLPARAPWLDDVETELLLFTGGDQDAHDDTVDSCAWAVHCLNEFGSDDGGEPMTLGRRAY